MRLGKYFHVSRKVIVVNRAWNESREMLIRRSTAACAFVSRKFVLFRINRRYHAKLAAAENWSSSRQSQVHRSIAIINRQIAWRTRLTFSSLRCRENSLEKKPEMKISQNLRQFNFSSCLDAAGCSSCRVWFQSEEFSSNTELEILIEWNAVKKFFGKFRPNRETVVVDKFR